MSPCLPEIKIKADKISDHPWVYHTALEPIKAPISNGSVVDLVGKNDDWLARGFYNKHARIAVRVLTRNHDENIDASFFERKIKAALELRQNTYLLDRVTNAYRLIHAEGDGLSGLVVDKYNDLIALEFFSSGMYKFRDIIIGCFKSFFPSSQFYWFAEKKVQKQESFDCHSPQSVSPVIIEEHGVKFHVRSGLKHKTGFYIDQRPNRLYFSQFCEGKRILDICSFTGGFSLYATTKGKAREVTAIDLDEEAIKLAKENATLNHASINFIQSDLLQTIPDLISKKELFDVIILDPPRLTKAQDKIDAVLKHYTYMNQQALQLVAKNGIFVTCSCTGLIKEDDFLRALRRAAFQVNRNLQVFHISGAGEDHPVSIAAPEGRYLKVVWCHLSD